MAKMLIANRLTDGLVVFRTGNGSWTQSIADGQLIVDDDAAAQLLEAALDEERDNRVIDPYLIDVKDVDGRRAPDVYREEIRANGPTVDSGP